MRSVDRGIVARDAVSGLTLAVVLLPQAIAFAILAGLPAETGLVTAVIGAIVGALWGSSVLVHTGPTSAVSLLVMSSVAATAPADPSAMVVVAGLLAVMAGTVQVILGVARLGVLVTFVSDAVIVGFAAGAGIQIAVSELRHVLRVDVAARALWPRLEAILQQLPDVHLPSLVIGTATIALLVGIRMIRRSWPATLLALLATSALAALLGPSQLGLNVIGALPTDLPRPQSLPIFDGALISSLATGALAIASIGLIQTMAVARSLPNPGGERLDANQEFVGQGLANIVAGWFSGFSVSGSFSRSAVAAETGARTPLAAVISGAFVLAFMLLFGPLGAYLPRAALAGILIVVAIKMIDLDRIRQVVRSSRGESVVMSVTFLGTLFLPIDVAVLAGILTALGHYVLRTSAPDVVPVRPDECFRHFVRHSPQDPCTQLAIFDIRGDLYFGATSHVEDTLLSHCDDHPDQRFLLLRMQGVNRIDVSGVRMLERLAEDRRRHVGDLYLTRIQRPVLRFMISTRFHETLGRDHFLNVDTAVDTLFHHVLDPAVCVYECRMRAFRECQTIPRPDIPLHLRPAAHVPTDDEVTVETIDAVDLWQELHGHGIEPRIIDVREPREFARGHIPGSENIPYLNLIADPSCAMDGTDRPIVIVCRGGRRSRSAGVHIAPIHDRQVRVLKGGLLSWESADLLTAMGTPSHSKTIVPG